MTTQPIPQHQPGDGNRLGDPIAFGLIVIGDEVLNGERSDKHLPAFKQMLAARGHGLAWYWMLPDEPAVLTRQLTASMAPSTAAMRRCSVAAASARRRTIIPVPAPQRRRAFGWCAMPRPRR